MVDLVVVEVVVAGSVVVGLVVVCGVVVVVSCEVGEGVIVVDVVVGF